jgi:dolichol-phosphate mannosyltransferase
MDADLQDPPETIPALLARWRAGADVVHTVRTHRHGEHPLKMLATRIGYRLIRLTSTIELTVDAGDFKLLSRDAVDHLLRVTESDPYMRGLVSWLGFNQVFVPYEREARHAGRTHFPFLSRGPWKAFLVGLTSFSFAPVYAVAILAAAGLAIAIGLLGAAAILMIRDSGYTQTTALIGLLILLWATTLGAVAVVGLYVTRIYKDVRRRPQYIIRSTIGIPAAPQTGRPPVPTAARTPELP